jgi:hypothetical protein
MTIKAAIRRGLAHGLILGTYAVLGYLIAWVIVCS